MLRTLLLVLVLASPLSAQDPLDVYIGTVLDLNEDDDLQDLLPEQRVESFADYIAATSGWRALLESIDSLRINKLVGASSGGAGTTALATSVAAPAIIGFGVEHGSILQEKSGTVNTLRANLLGLAKLAAGAEQFPYCAQTDLPSCRPWSRRLRQLSGSISFENADGSGQLPTAGGNVDSYRMSAWGLRLDLTPSSNLDDPKYIEDWHMQIAALRGSDAAGELTRAISELIQPALGAFEAANREMLTALQQAPLQDRRKVLRSRLDGFIATLEEAIPDFPDRIEALLRASAAYRAVRDEAVRSAQTHKLSLEYLNQRPINQRPRSSFKLVYSHQPTEAPVLVTVNFATTFYHDAITGTDLSRFRDIEFAVQIDRQLTSIGQFQNPVLTFAGYYQWLQEDVRLTIPASDLAPGTAIALPDGTAALLGTKGHIGIAQAKLSFPFGEHLKVPVSFTWASRTELIKERDVSGQVGLTLDLDTFFR